MGPALKTTTQLAGEGKKRPHEMAIFQVGDESMSWCRWISVVIGVVGNLFWWVMNLSNRGDR